MARFIVEMTWCLQYDFFSCGRYCGIIAEFVGFLEVTKLRVEIMLELGVK